MESGDSERNEFESGMLFMICDVQLYIKCFLFSNQLTIYCNNIAVKNLTCLFNIAACCLYISDLSQNALYVGSDYILRPVHGGGTFGVSKLENP